MPDKITTLLEVVGLVLLAVAAGLLVSSWSLPGGLATSGVVLILEAALINWRSRPRQDGVGDETA